MDFSLQEITSMMLSFSVGNFIGSRLYAAYPPHAQPKTWDPGIDRRLKQAGWLISGKWLLTDIDGSVLTRVELDKKMEKEALAKIKQNPAKFFLTGFAGLFRLNAPMNYGGEEVMNLFVGTHTNIPPAAKIGIIILIRGAWYAFLSIVIYALIAHKKDWRTWGLPALIIVYYNGTHAFFTHAEVRYVLAVMPFYFLFAVEGLRLLHQRFFARV